MHSIRRHELHNLFRGLGVSVALWIEEAEAQFDWPPLQLLIPSLNRKYPQGGTFIILDDWCLSTAPLACVAGGPQ